MATDKITSAGIADDIISGKTALGAEPADTDEFLKELTTHILKVVELQK